MTNNVLQDRYDVVVVGGGAAGLNGALMLARSRRSVTVIDDGDPRNAPAAGVHGLLGHDGVPPAELLAKGREEVQRYGGHVAAGAVTTIVREADGFRVDVADFRSIRARRVLIATGVVDELPAVTGLRERWGRDVVHCPYCHGWEVRDRAIGVLAVGPLSVHQAQMFRQLSDDVVYFTHMTPPLPPEQAEELAARGIRVVEGTVTDLEITDDAITGVRLADGKIVPRAAIAVGSYVAPRTGLLDALGLSAVEHPSGMGRYVPSEGGRTDVPGVWVAGNVTDMMAQVGPSAAAGAMAGAQINGDLIAEETARAVEARRSGQEPAPAADPVSAQV
ncbi:NAD(P)/FAD-dependent oxidoreductase [Georgenia halophila]|uniref:NAD(P)/FAD-dependent oxidoreductase n=1 Tax=Georgenia halophila TaxID=620889 RepID=A0ABP8KRW8_9MICO